MVCANSHQVWLNLWVPVEEFCDNWQAPLPCFQFPGYRHLLHAPGSPYLNTLKWTKYMFTLYAVSYKDEKRMQLVHAVLPLNEPLLLPISLQAECIDAHLCIYMYSTYMHYTVWSNCYLVPIHTKRGCGKNRLHPVQRSTLHFWWLLISHSWKCEVSTN